MRLFLLPVSTRRILIYCQRNVGTTQKPQTLIDRATARAAQTWLSWERGDKKWQQVVVDLGNKVLRSVPFEEWGLKSIPPLAAQRKEEALREKAIENVDVAFPSSIIRPVAVGEALMRLATERQTLHQRRMWWSIVGMPISAPIALIPILPNIPFFYLLFRAWSHWRALSGSRHLQFLIENQFITPSSSTTLDRLYEPQLQRLAANKVLEVARSSERRSDASPDLLRELEGDQNTEVVLLGPSDGKRCADALGVPELAVEVERAVEQVEKSVRAFSEQVKQ